VKRQKIANNEGLERLVSNWSFPQLEVNVKEKKNIEKKSSGILSDGGARPRRKEDVIRNGEP